MKDRVSGLQASSPTQVPTHFAIFDVGLRAAITLGEGLELDRQLKKMSKMANGNIQK